MYMVWLDKEKLYDNYSRVERRSLIIFIPPKKWIFFSPSDLLNIISVSKDEHIKKSYFSLNKIYCDYIFFSIDKAWVVWFFSILADVLSNFVFFFPFVLGIFRKCFSGRNPNKYHFFDLCSWKMDDSCSFASVDTFSKCSIFFFVDILIFFYRRLLILIIYFDYYSFV